MLNDNDTLDIVINVNDDVTFTFGITSDINSTSWPNVVGTMHNSRNCKYCIWTRCQSEVQKYYFYRIRSSNVGGRILATRTLIDHHVSR